MVLAIVAYHLHDRFLCFERVHSAQLYLKGYMATTYWGSELGTILECIDYDRCATRSSPFCPHVHVQWT